MNVHLRVERIVLHGIDLDAGASDALGAAVGAELRRLLTERVPLTGTQGGAVPLLHAEPLQLDAGASPHDIGIHLAGAVYGSLQL